MAKNTNTSCSPCRRAIKTPQPRNPPAKTNACAEYHGSNSRIELHLATAKEGTTYRALFFMRSARFPDDTLYALAACTLGQLFNLKHIKRTSPLSLLPIKPSFLKLRLRMREGVSFSNICFPDLVRKSRVLSQPCLVE